LQGFMIHFDNASPHNSRRSRECLGSYRATRLQHPAYSPDPAASDFFLFGYLKEKLIDFDCRSREDLKSAITSIVTEIDKETLVAVFLSWIERLKWMIRKEGRYYHKQTRDVKYWFKIGRETGRSRTFGPPYIPWDKYRAADHLPVNAKGRRSQSWRNISDKACIVVLNLSQLDLSLPFHKTNIFVNIDDNNLLITHFKIK
jgi:hypothetical protein